MWHRRHTRPGGYVATMPSHVSLRPSYIPLCSLHVSLPLPALTLFLTSLLLPRHASISLRLALLTLNLLPLLQKHLDLCLELLFIGLRIRNVEPGKFELILEP